MTIKTIRNNFPGKVVIIYHIYQMNGFYMIKLFTDKLTVVTKRTLKNQK